MRTAFTLILISFLFRISIGQNPVFTGSADASEIVEGAYVEVSFTLENAEGGNIKAPSFNGFKLISGPNRSSHIFISNGRRSQKMSWSYTLLASKEGTYKIGSASIQVRNKKITSQAFKIKVVKGRVIDQALGPDGLPTEEMIFVKAEISDSVAYIGQQIILNYKLYTTQDIQSYDITSQPNFDGFYVENVKDFRNTFKTEIINGVQYRTRILKTFALFPQRTGFFTFEPMYLRLGIPYKDNNSRRFFFNTKVRPMPVNTDEVILEIKNLPGEAPESFSGAVGKFTMRSNINSRKLCTDDAIIISMEVTGNGDGRKISPPKFALPDQFELYDPKVTKDENMDKLGRVINYKIFEFVAVPLEKGRYQIQPEFSYFDTDSLNFVVLRSGPFHVEISKGTRPKSESHSFISGAENMEMKPLMVHFDSSKKPKAFYGSKGFWGINSLLFLSFFSLIVVKVYQSNKEEKDPTLLKKENANKLALDKLYRAKTKMDHKQEKPFYQEIALAFWGYASDKLGIDTADITKNMLSEKLQSMNVEQNLVLDYVSVLKECEKVNYAGVADTNMTRFYEHCITLISSVEAQIVRHDS